LVNSKVFTPEIRCHQLEQQRGYNAAYIQWWSHDEFTSQTCAVGGLEFSIHCTPGHTPGHVVIIGNGIVISGDCLFLRGCGRTDLLGGDRDKQRASLKYLQTIFNTLSGTNLVVPGHQYKLPDGTTPTVMQLSKVITSNEALSALNDDAKWESLPFLSFDDDIAAKARRQKAQQS
jgi:glyoxylase-like metal-dependent hydrolase (beta-lactamase superfamily II)